MITNKHFDFVIVGAGIIGISLSIQLKKIFKDSSVCILEKESRHGFHASGRNSGVLHAGFYYTENSIKARFCKEGNIALTEYCLEKNIPINRCGKVVVCQNEEDHFGMEVLFKRAKNNGVKLEYLSEKDLIEIEPYAKTIEKALFSPNTSSASCKDVIDSLYQDATALGVKFFFSESFISLKDIKKIETNKSFIEFGYLINCAGVYADKVARFFGCSNSFSIIPFKGIYLKSKKPHRKIKRHIYPVPNMAHPFLGTHFTSSIDGYLKIGPTAIPALWLEQYEFFKNFKLSEFLKVARKELALFFKSPFNFKKLAYNEYSKLIKSNMINEANKLTNINFEKNDFIWASPGIRAQLINNKTHNLEMDFIIETSENSMHILNAVSPAWTCALSFTKHISERILKELST